MSIAGSPARSRAYASPRTCNTRSEVDMLTLRCIQYAMHSFGFTATSNIAVTYAVDSYSRFDGEALVTIFVGKYYGRRAYQKLC